MSAHVLVVEWSGGEYGPHYTIECANPAECDDVFTEGEWPNLWTCRCEEPECDCRSEEHGGCFEFGRYIPDIGPECRSIPVEGCGYAEWVDIVGPEMISDKFPPHTFRVPVEFRWEHPGDGPVAIPPGKEEAT